MRPLAKSFAILAAIALVGPACGSAPPEHKLTAASASWHSPPWNGWRGLSTTTSSTTTTTMPPRRVTPATVPAQPVPRPVAPSTRSTGQASAPSSGQSLGTFTATCYGAFEGYGGRTASGQQSGPGSIATDPRVIPMGTHLHVAGYGAGVANDVGGAIKGHRIDVWFRTAAECSAWGTRSVEVWAT